MEEFIQDLQQTSISSSGIPLFISIDQEGGRVKRIKQGITDFPGNMAFGVVEDKELMNDAARILGIQLRLLGVNMNLAPVLDVNNNPRNPVINTRSFGSDPDIVSMMGIAYIKGLQDSKCISVGKHFPGHGDTDKDSHITLPEISYNIERLQKVEFIPFVEAINEEVECIMTAHISFPSILNNNLPATLSDKFLNEILRKKMKFNGLIITDDLEMKAISEMMNIGEAAVKSIKAGADIVLISSHGNDLKKVARAIKEAVKSGYLSQERIDISVKRIIEMKLRYDIMSFDNGRIKYINVKYSDDEIDMISRADEINRRASREAIYYYNGDNVGLIPINIKGITRIFITSDNLLIEEANKDRKNNRVFTNEEAFFRFSKIHSSLKYPHDPGSGQIVIYYHVENVRIELIKRIIKTAEEENIKLILLATGNPFPLSELEYIPPTLFTFSDTRESIKQMIACLRGEFEPKSRININLGMIKSRE